MGRLRNTSQIASGRDRGNCGYAGGDLPVVVVGKGHLRVGHFPSKPQFEDNAREMLAGLCLHLSVATHHGNDRTARVYPLLALGESYTPKSQL